MTHIGRQYPQLLQRYLQPGTPPNNWAPYHAKFEVIATAGNPPLGTTYSFIAGAGDYVAATITYAASDDDDHGGYSLSLVQTVAVPLEGTRWTVAFNGPLGPISESLILHEGYVVWSRLGGLIGVFPSGLALAAFCYDYRDAILH